MFSFTWCWHPVKTRWNDNLHIQSSFCVYFSRKLLNRNKQRITWVWKVFVFFCIPGLLIYLLCDLGVSDHQDGDDDDEDWAEETTEEAQRRRMEEISDHAKNLTLSDDLEKPLEERVNLFYNFVKVMHL